MDVPYAPGKYIFSCLTSYHISRTKINGKYPAGQAPSVSQQILDHGTENFRDDEFFKDSPNAGEPGCRCSRCHKQIEEHETPLRVAVIKSMMFSRNDNTGEERKSLSTDMVNGLEFRLCEKCTNKLMQNQN